MRAMQTSTSEESSLGGMGVVGPRLREIRGAKGISLTEVADSAGITKGFLSLAERGRTRVSVPTLLRICEVLDVRIGDLFDYPSEPIVHGGTRIEMGGVGIEEFLLSPAEERHLQAMRTVLEPGGGSGGAYRIEAETIFAHVLRGNLHLVVDGEVRELNAGDSTTFAAQSLHEWHNPSASVSEVLWVVTPPIREPTPGGNSP